MIQKTTIAESVMMTSGHALMSAARCLGCHDAPCSRACPAGVDVPGFIRRFLDGNLQGAGALVYQRCPLGATCGLACPTEMLCEGACVLRQAGQPAVPIGALQAYVCLQYTGNESVGRLEKAGNVAIIGAGPAGLGCAVGLRRYGHQVMLYDRNEQLAGLVNKVIPAHRLPAAVVEYDLQYLNALGLNFLPAQPIGSLEFKRICAEYDAVFLGTGMSGLQKADFPGQSASGVLNVMQFLERARHGQAVVDLKQTVVVVGGGNVALDAAVVAKRNGAHEVIVLYRRSRDEMPGWEKEYLEAARVGVEFRWLSTVTAIEEKAGKVNAVMVQKMRFTDKKRDGRRWVEVDPHQPPAPLPCHLVIPALGQAVECDWLAALGLKLTPDGFPRVDAKTRQTSLPKVYAGGEVVTGGSTIVESLNQGLQAAESMHAALSGKGG